MQMYLASLRQFIETPSSAGMRCGLRTCKWEIKFPSFFNIFGISQNKQGSESLDRCLDYLLRDTT